MKNTLPFTFTRQVDCVSSTTTFDAFSANVAVDAAAVSAADFAADAADDAADAAR